MKKRIFGAVALCLTVAALAARSEDNTEKREYKWRLEKGQNYVLQTSVERKTAQTVSGKTENLEQTTGFECHFVIQDVEQDGSAWVNYSYKKANIKLKAPGVDVVFDSTKDTKLPLQALSLALLLGESYYFKMTPQGKVERINGLDMVLTNMKAKIPSVQGRDKIAESFRRQMDEQAVRKEMERIFAIYPQSAVAVGEPWQTSEVLAEGAGMVVDKTSQIKERKNGIAVIDVNIVIRPNPQSQPVRMGEMMVKWEASGNGRGKIETDEATGRIISGKIRSEWIEQAKVISAGARRRPEGPIASVKTQVVTTCEMSEQNDEPAGSAEQPIPAAPDVNK